VQYGDFGETDVKQEKLKKLKKTLDLAESKSSVIVTLFDFTVITHSKRTLTHRHARKIVFHIQEPQSNFGFKNEPI
jgi:hypothetical protein